MEGECYMLWHEIEGMDRASNGESSTDGASWVTTTGSQRPERQ